MLSARHNLAALAIVALLSASACGPVITVEQDGAADQHLVEQGEPLYQAHCAECHGMDLRGTDEGPSHLSAVYEPNHHADGAFSLAVTRGVPEHHWRFGPMPPIEGLDDTDIEAIIAFVRDQQEREGFDPYPP